MSANEKVFQVLVPSGNQAIAAVGTNLDTLKEGQIGVFDNDTKLALDAATAVNSNKIFIAVGRGTYIDDSAGQDIPLQYLEAVTYRKAQPAVNQVQLISGFDNIACDTDYTLRLEVRNGKIAQVQGTVGFYKSFSFRTSACPVDGSKKGDVKDFVKKFYEAIKLDQSPENFYKVTVVDTAKANAKVTDIDAAANTVKFGILIESLPVGETVFAGGINPTYYKDRQSIINISLVENLKENGVKVSTVTASKNAEGSGYDLHQQEYMAMGWKGNIYRQSGLHGLEFQNGLEYHIEKRKTYSVFHLVYENKGYAGWGSYKHPLQTIIAVPEADTTTSDALLTVLKAVAKEGEDTVVMEK